MDAQASKKSARFGSLAEKAEHCRFDSEEAMIDPGDAGAEE
jgi:hypothetical protein